jgi:VWFA-related protein
MRVITCICAALLGGIVTAAVSQQTPFLVRDKVTSTARDETNGLIHLDVVVTDKSGKPVTGLRRDDFSLLENGQSQKILSFHAHDGTTAKPDPPPWELDDYIRLLPDGNTSTRLIENNSFHTGIGPPDTKMADTVQAPVQIILMLDTIELPEALARNERIAVESFLRKNGGKLVRPLSVYWLTDTGLWTVAHPSGDGNALAGDLEHSNLSLVRHVIGSQLGTVPSSLRTKDPAGDSALKALGQIASNERRVPGRKLLLWIGPGAGTGSGAEDVTFGEGPAYRDKPFYTVCWFSTLLREARVVLYSFAVGETEPQLKYKSYLAGVQSPQKAGYMNLDRKVLAVQSGGRVMDESFDLVKEIEDCVREADAFYTISFDPLSADHADEYHTLKVQVGRPAVTARTNTGYYDQPFYSVERVPAVQRVSVLELENLVDSLAGEPDAEIARKLDKLELTERLSGTRLAAISSKLHGKKSQVALLVLTNMSEFLDPPADEIPRDAAPGAAAQQQILAKTAEYLKTTIPRLPDLFAKQMTVRYQETPQFSEGPTRLEFQPLHETDTLKATVHYRAGFEVADLETKTRKKKWNDPQLITYGTFGPVLQGVTQAISQHGELTWSHWEHSAAGGNAAVFRYVIPADKSLYEVGLCCLPDGDGRNAFVRYAGYHGVIAIDPASGAILRLAWEADLKSTTPLSRSDVMIEYGPVEIAGKTYICPLRSISIVRGRSVDVLGEWDESFRTYGPYAIMLNDITFSRYHVFRSESRVLPGFDASGAK